jgi:hypothetical protein
MTDSHIALLVFGMFNASLSGTSLTSQYTYNYLSGAWYNYSTISHLHLIIQHNRIV